jgi:parallel beta-helix repeat protein
LDGATLVISSNDTKWLKINSTSANSPHSIVSRGNLIINNTKISSWNTTSDQETTFSDFNTPRSYIALLSDARGHMNITNSNLTNLGFNGGQGTWGISYYSGGGSIVQNSNLSSNYRSLYFGQNASDIFVSNNTINNSVQTGLAIYKSSNIDITDNEIRNNGLQGIACLQQCNTIMVKDNEIYSNIRDGIRFDKRTTNSSLQNNHIYDNALSGIAIRNSSGNIITGNSLYNNKVGITLVQSSAANTINNNSIQNSSLYGMHFQSNSNSNRVEKNTLNYSQHGGIAINEAKNNTFFDNRLANNSNFGMRFRSASENILTDNIVLDNMPYNFYFKSSSTSNSFKNTIFDNSSIRFFDNTSNVIIENTDNILTANNKKIPTIAYATNTTLYLVPTTKNIVVDTLDMAVTPSNNHVNISSISKDFKTNTNYKKWIETSESPEIESKYIIGDFDPNTQIGINVNGSFWNAFTSNATGHITFLYDKASRQNSLIAEFEAYPSNHAAISVIVLFGIIVAASAGTILVRRFFKTNNSSKPMDPPMNKSLQKQFKESA